MEKGYYIVTFYNHAGKYIMYFNGKNFEGFMSIQYPNDEIESSKLLEWL